MSSFGAKRKARVIKVDEDEPESSTSSTTPPTQPGAKDDTSNAPSMPAVKFTRKPLRQSGLRKSININDETGNDTQSSTSKGSATAAKISTSKDGDGGDDEDDGPVVIRPNIGRSGSVKNKKKNPSARLSFGPGQQDGDEEQPSSFVTPKKSGLGQQARETSAIKKSAFGQQRLPLRRFDEEEDDRPKYSKEYLEELQSSTPNTPKNLTTAAQGQKSGDEDMGLDASELEGALIVNEGEYGSGAMAAPPPPQQTAILTDTQIQERKQRRARLAKEQSDDFISLDDRDDNNDNDPDKEPESRLVREDEDLGEGFDEFVQDEDLSLGKKAEREAKLRRRKEMAEQIQLAEGNSDEESDESDAERRAAFEAAQTRSAMDGLDKPSKRGRKGDRHAQEAQVPAKITPLPELEGCLQKLRVSIQGMQAEVQSKQGKIDELRGEKEAILAREKEVQGLLDEAGKKYTSVLGTGAAAAGGQEPAAVASSTASLEAGQSPAQQIRDAGVSELAVERGLESFGTPSKRPDVGQEE